MRPKRFGSRGPSKNVRARQKSTKVRQLMFTRPVFPARSPQILHRSELTERDWENAVQGQGNREEKCDVTLPWKHYFWMTTKPTTTATARRTAKNNLFKFTNNNFRRASRYFVHCFAVVAPLRHETSYFHEPALWSRWTQHKNVAFFF